MDSRLRAGRLLTVMRYPNEGFATLDQPLTLEPIGIAVPANDPQLENLVRNYVTALEGTGILEALRQAWLEKWLLDRCPSLITVGPHA